MSRERQRRYRERRRNCDCVLPVVVDEVDLSEKLQAIGLLRPGQDDSRPILQTLLQALIKHARPSTLLPNGSARLEASPGGLSGPPNV